MADLGELTLLATVRADDAQALRETQRIEGLLKGKLSLDLDMTPLQNKFKATEDAAIKSARVSTRAFQDASREQAQTERQAAAAGQARLREANQTAILNARLARDQAQLAQEAVRAQRAQSAEADRVRRAEERAAAEAYREGMQRLRDRQATEKLNADLQRQAQREAAQAARTALLAERQKQDAIRATVDGLRNEQASVRSLWQAGRIAAPDLVSMQQDIQRRALQAADAIDKQSNAYRRLTQVAAAAQNTMDRATGKITPGSLSNSMVLGIQQSGLFNQISALGGPAAQTLGIVASGFATARKNALEFGNASNTAATAAGFLAGGLTTLGVAVVGVGAGLASLASTGLRELKTLQGGLNVLTASGVTDLQGFKSEVKALKEELGVVGKSLSTADLTASAADLVKANLSAADALTVLASSSKLAAAEGTNLNQTSAQLLMNLRQYGLAVDQAGKVTDMFAKAGNLAAGTANDLSLGFGKVGGTGMQAGIAMYDLLGMLVELDLKGMSAADVGADALRTALSSLADPSEKAKGILSELGIEIDDASGKARPAGDIMAELGQKMRGMGISVNASTGELSGNGDALRTVAGLMDTRAAAAVINLTGEWKTHGEAIKDSEGYATDYAETMSQGVAPAQQRLQTAFKDAGLAFMENFAGPIADFLDNTATPFMENLGGIFEKLQNIKNMGDLKLSLKISSDDSGTTAFLKFLTGAVVQVGQTLGKIVDFTGDQLVGMVKRLDAAQLARQLVDVGAVAKPRNADEGLKFAQAVMADMPKYQDILAKALEKNTAAADRLAQSLGLRPPTKVPNVTGTFSGIGPLLPGQTRPGDVAREQDNFSYAFISGLADVFKTDPRVASDCAVIAYAILDTLGAKIKGTQLQNANVGVLEKNALASGFQKVEGDEIRAGDLIVWTSGNGKRYGAVSGKHVGVAAGYQNGKLMVINNPGSAPTVVEPMYDRRNAVAYRAPTSPFATGVAPTSTQGTGKPDVNEQLKQALDEGHRLIRQYGLALASGNELWIAKARGAVEEFRKTNRVAWGSLKDDFEKVGKAAEQSTATVKGYGQQFEALSRRLRVAESLGSLGQNVVPQLKNIRDEAQKAADSEKKRNGETEKYVKLLDLAGDANRRLASIQNRKTDPAQSPLEKEQAQQRQIIANERMIADLRNASAKRLNEIIRGGVNEQTSLAKWEAARQVLEERSKPKKDKDLTPLQREEQQQQKIIANEKMLADVRGASARRLREIAAAGVGKDVSLAKWEAARAEIQRRADLEGKARTQSKQAGEQFLREQEAQQDRLARRMEEIGRNRQAAEQALAAGSLALARDKAQATVTAYEDELRAAGESASARLEVEKRLGAEVLAARDTLARTSAEEEKRRLAAERNRLMSADGVTRAQRQQLWTQYAGRIAQVDTDLQATLQRNAQESGRVLDAAISGVFTEDDAERARDYTERVGGYLEGLETMSEEGLVEVYNEGVAHRDQELLRAVYAEWERRGLEVQRQQQVIAEMQAQANTDFARSAGETADALGEIGEHEAAITVLEEALAELYRRANEDGQDAAQAISDLTDQINRLASAGALNDEFNLFVAGLSGTLDQQIAQITERIEGIADPLDPLRRKLVAFREGLRAELQQAYGSFQGPDIYGTRGGEAPSTREMLDAQGAKAQANSLILSLPNTMDPGLLAPMVQGAVDLLASEIGQKLPPELRSALQKGVDEAMPYLEATLGDTVEQTMTYSWEGVGQSFTELADDVFKSFGEGTLGQDVDSLTRRFEEASAAGKITAEDLENLRALVARLNAEPLDLGPDPDDQALEDWNRKITDLEESLAQGKIAQEEFNQEALSAIVTFERLAVAADQADKPELAATWRAAAQGLSSLIKPGEEASEVLGTLADEVMVDTTTDLVKLRDAFVSGATGTQEFVEGVLTALPRLEQLAQAAERAGRADLAAAYRQMAQELREMAPAAAGVLEKLSKAQKNITYFRDLAGAFGELTAAIGETEEEYDSVTGEKLATPWKDLTANLEGATEAADKVLAIMGDVARVVANPADVGAWVGLITKVVSGIADMIAGFQKAKAEVARLKAEFAEQNPLLNPEDYQKTFTRSRGFFADLFKGPEVVNEIDKIGLPVAQRLAGSITQGIKTGFDRYLETGNMEDFAKALSGEITNGVKASLVEGFINDPARQNEYAAAIKAYTDAWKTHDPAAIQAAAQNIYAQTQATTAAAKELAAQLDELDRVNQTGRYSPEAIAARERELAERRMNTEETLLEVSLRSRLISQEDYERQKLDLTIRRLRAEMAAELAAAGLTAEQIAAIQADYAARIRLAEAEAAEARRQRELRLAQELADLRMNNEQKALDLQHRAKLISDEEYARRSLDLTLRRLDEEERRAIEAAEGSEALIAEIRERFRLERAAAEQDFADQQAERERRAVERGQRLAVSALDNEIGALENRRRARLLSEAEYQNQLLALTLRRLEAQRQAELLGAEDDAERAIINASFANQIEAARLAGQEAARAQAEGYGSTLSGAFDTMLRGGSVAETIKNKLGGWLAGQIEELRIGKRLGELLADDMNSFTEGLRSGAGAEGLIAQLAARVPGIAAQLELENKPYVEAMRKYFPELTQALDTNTSALRDVQISQTTIVDATPNVSYTNPLRARLSRYA